MSVTDYTIKADGSGSGGSYGADSDGGGGGGVDSGGGGGGFVCGMQISSRETFHSLMAAENERKFFG